MLVRITMSGICGTDKHGYKGQAVQYAGTQREVFGPYPAVPGHENLGVIEELAEPRTDFYGLPLRVGDRVLVSPDIVCGECFLCRHSFGYSWCDRIRSYGHLSSDVWPHLLGGWADLMYVLPGSHVYRVPDEISDDIAVLAEPMAVTYSLDLAKSWAALPRQGFSAGDTVVVFGVGPLGIFHLIKARLMGAGTLVAVDVSPYRLELARALGADVTLDPRQLPGPELVTAVRDLTHGLGADVVVECVGIPSVIRDGIEMLRQGGTFVEVGNFVDSGELSLSPHRHFVAKNIRLLGMTNLAYTGFIPSITLLHRHRHELPLARVITHRFPLERAEEALVTSMEPESMKVVIAP